MPNLVKPCSVPGCQRPRPTGLRASFSRGQARQVKIPVCPWCLLGITPESRDLTAFQGKRQPPQRVRERWTAWMQREGYDEATPPPPGSGQVPGKLSTVRVDVDLDIERTPEQALHDGLIMPRARGRGYGATDKGRAAIQQLRRRQPPLGARVIQRRVGLGKATVVAIIQQLEAKQ